MERRGELHPKKRSGIVYHSELEIEELVLARRGVTSTAFRISGRTTARAFALFERGVNLREAVRELELPPEIIDQLYAQWSEPNLEQRRRTREQRQQRAELDRTKQQNALDFDLLLRGRR